LFDHEFRVRISWMLCHDFSASAVAVSDSLVEIHRAVGPVDQDPAVLRSVTQAHVIGRQGAARIFQQSLNRVRVGAAVFPYVYAPGGHSMVRQFSKHEVDQVDAVTHPLAKAAAGIRPEQTELAVVARIPSVLLGIEVAEILLPVGTFLFDGVFGSRYAPALLAQ